MAWCRTAKTAVSTGCSRRSECCERTIGTSPPSDAAAMARCVGELCAPQNTSPRAKVYTVIVVASIRSARYLARRVVASSAWCGAARGGAACGRVLRLGHRVAVRVVGAKIGEADGTIRAAGSRAARVPTRRRPKRAAPVRQAARRRLRMAEALSRGRQRADPRR